MTPETVTLMQGDQYKYVCLVTTGGHAILSDLIF